MPVKSKAQWAYLAIHQPKILRDWQKETPRTRSKLPKHVKKPKSR